jgi:NAD(P)-dependent dehydrogenase (short-subunit alcohol dehydrogenase family)
MTSPTPLLTPSTDRPSAASAVALITGGGRGIGRLVAQGLSATGTAVALMARSGDELDETVELVERAGGTAAAARADVTDPTDLDSAVADLRRRLGPVDLLINGSSR